MPKWVTLAKDHINDTLAIKVNTWWSEIFNYASPSKKSAKKPTQVSIYF